MARIFATRGMCSRLTPCFIAFLLRLMAARSAAMGDYLFYLLSSWGVGYALGWQVRMIMRAMRAGT